MGSGLPVCQDWISSDETGPLTSCGEVSCPGEQTSHAQRGRTPECVPDTNKRGLTPLDVKSTSNQIRGQVQR